MKNYFYSLGLVLIVSGCMNPAAKGPLFDQVASPAADRSAVYFFRPMENDRGTVCLNIIMNDEDLGCLGTKGYLCNEMPPGKYIVRFRPNAYPVHTLLKFEIELVPGDTKFYSYKIGERITEDTVVSKYTAGGTISIQDVEESAAAGMLSSLRNSVLPPVSE